MLCVLFFSLWWNLGHVPKFPHSVCLLPFPYSCALTGLGGSLNNFTASAIPGAVCVRAREHRLHIQGDISTPLSCAPPAHPFWRGHSQSKRRPTLNEIGSCVLQQTPAHGDTDRLPEEGARVTSKLLGPAQNGRTPGCCQ